MLSGFVVEYFPPGESQLNFRSRALRVAFVAALTIGVSGLGAGLAPAASATPYSHASSLLASASANAGFPSSSPVTPIAGHEVDTGVIVLEFDPSQAGLSAAVSTPDPADSTAISTQTGTIAADGSVTIRDFAGPAAVYLQSADGQVHELGGVPLPGTTTHRQAASIYRGQTWTYAYSSNSDTFTAVAFPPTPVQPSTAAEVVTQIPITHYTVTTSGVAGQGNLVFLTFSSVSPNGIGDPNYSSQATTYVYGAPDAVGGSFINHGTYHVVIPALYSYGVHTVASFDKYGRLVATTTVGDATMPPAPPGSSAAAHPLDTGTVLIQVSNIMFGTIFTSTVADPTAPGALSVVSSSVGHGGLVALTNFAGPARIDVESTPENNFPATLTGEVNIYRAQLVTYGYPSVSNVDSNPFGHFGPAPAPVIPASAEEAEALTPVATSTVSPSSWQPGSDVTLDVTNVTPTAATDDASLTVDNYVYSTPTLLGSSTISLATAASDGSHAYSFVVPGAFTSGGHVAASFDQFGRLVTLDRLDGAVTAAGSNPAIAPAATSTSSSEAPSQTATAAAADATALANTGQNDLIPAGIAATVLFGAGAIVLAVSYRRRASTRRR
ncbi:hypothetical protein GCM10011399_22290 [Subtercola lobariae]|uniref:Uncharacterized protein n=2 Tax=Subtercola lobariae TaxID=1588641 RepID=A0A917B7R5_9MICO|nr:hypothetical protein GCM10011399_22290 [Subtercola lobariae]